MKVLFDANVYVAEALVGGMAGRVVDAAVEARWRVYASDHLLDEVERVLRDRLGFSRRLAAATRRRAARRATAVAGDEPASRHRVPGDPNDNPILQAAIGFGVDYLVTNDRHLLSLDPYEGVRIVSITDFRDLLRDRGLLELP